MAQIAVERRGGARWWIWLIIALIIIGIIWYFAAAGTHRNAAVTQPGAIPATGEASRTGTAAGAPITDITELANVADANTFAGRQVDTGPVTVSGDAGSRAFWVGQNQGQQVLVVPNQQANAKQPAAGQSVRVHGTVEPLPAFQQAQQMWNLESNIQAQYEKQKVYVSADRVETTNRP